MDLNLGNGIILVTGGASGIGEAVTRLLCAEGAQVCIMDKDAERMNLLVNEILAQGQQVEGYAVDLTDSNNCSTVFASIVAKHGRITGLVNNAGVNDGVALSSGTPSKFMASLDRNVIHYIQLINLALPYLRQSRGSVVNISSKVAQTGQGGTSAYAAANGIRSALANSYTRGYSGEVRFNTVIVAECWTPQYAWWINGQSQPEEELRKITSRIPLMNRMTSAEEIANTVAFLLSEKSASVQAQQWHVDGGYVHLDRRVN